ncbi:protein phosphatase 2C, putative [Trypanosoma brucei gambiense DAL972]|uniref:Protein phosphatase 2C, putative n=1 Tax=Trypanosoma brucei gambiense (strain MHOM/CI/86/DAL972) TaxID=679716 RepID=D0A5L0_TRYB9|nr:protein phosphatase 2C, putative [Trypanosoma brucei gambiense DAL972]CBH16961.1 protein phosphatase 2C, putative [Trypanosoma brucei gambiense DAL972]|eukprot:XP_011779225.1 protein phosphatase 2C, putative [Trypanosoma brucei gambiense DAL972]
MGVSLPKPVMTHLRERCGNDIFRCGSSCVNGYRESMEDAHLVYLQPSWGFFGVFDGHVNDNCSQFLEGAWRSALEKENMPMSDDRMKELTLAIDKEWMDKACDGGSTGTFFVGMKENNTVHLQVGNVGDSRVLVCVDGKARAMTEDHKPNNADERRRIEECGGRVESNRVDGSLAVSRAFGDRDYKANPSGGQLSQKVIALPDVTHVDVTWDSKDFAVLCCDGVFEGQFSNEEVVDFIKEQMEQTDDLGLIAGRVCEEAVNRGSRDNVSCVIVQFKSGKDYATAEHLEVVPGPFSIPRNGTFRKVYSLMAEKGGMTTQEVLEKRYDYLASLEDKTAHMEEWKGFKDGPPANLEGKERTEWFSELFEQYAAETPSDPRSDNMERIQMLQQQIGIPLPMLLSIMSGQSEE